VRSSISMTLPAPNLAMKYSGKASFGATVFSSRASFSGVSCSLLSMHALWIGVLGSAAPLNVGLQFPVVRIIRF